MREPTMMNLILTFRVLLVGGLLFILPRITRKGLLFGVYVGEECAAGDEGRRILRSWGLGLAAVMAASLAVGFSISAAGWPVAGNLTGTGVLLLLALVVYLRTYSKARELALPVAERQAERATAALGGGESKGELLARLALVVCLVASLSTVVYAVVRYEDMPERVSALSIMFVPSLSLLLTPFLAVLALLTSRAKRSVREGSGGCSAEAQDAFRATMARTIGGTALLMCAFLTFLSIRLIRLGLSEIDFNQQALSIVEILGVPALSVGGVFFLFVGGNLFRIMKQYGQGGALIEGSPMGRPLAGGLADNARWVWGLFYVDRSDPSIMVEKRFGLGYTLNYGNRYAVWLVAGFLVLLLSLVALVLVMGLS
jgi:uncharacterized membrane protein